MKRIVLRVLIMATAGVLLTLGCQNPTGGGQGGVLTISINDAVSKTLLPDISMDPAGYDLEGSGPNGAEFSQTLSGGSSATITGLAFGDWTVTVTARNASGAAIGAGGGTVTVISNSTTTLWVTVRPYDGFGTLNLDLSWPAEEVQTAQVESSLTPAEGAARSLNFIVDGGAGTATFSASDAAAGYHTLILKLLDNGYLTMGAVEVVRIVKDAVTSGSFSFTNLNRASGTLVVNVTPEMEDPLEVAITGAAATKPADVSLPLSAGVSNYAGNVTYVWYVNGNAAATGTDYSFADTWPEGYYRIDVTAFTIDGTRAGSATADVQVVAAAGALGPAPVNLGAAGDYAILAKAAVTTVAPSAITGDIGLSPAMYTYFTGFELEMDSSWVFATSPQVTGRLYAADMAYPTPTDLTIAVMDMETAYADAAARTFPDAINLGAGEIGGLTIPPGLYMWNTGVTISANVTLSGGPDDVWILQIPETLNIANAVQVILSGGAQAGNIFWQVGGDATLGAFSQFAGNILSYSYITLGTGAVMLGRALSQTMVFLDQSTVVQP